MSLRKLMGLRSCLPSAFGFSQCLLTFAASFEPDPLQGAPRLWPSPLPPAEPAPTLRCTLLLRRLLLSRLRGSARPKVDLAVAERPRTSKIYRDHGARGKWDPTHQLRANPHGQKRLRTVVLITGIRNSTPPKKLDDEWPESIFHHVGSQSARYLLSVQCEVLSRVS